MNAKLSQYDKMTKTPVEKLIVTLAIPTILTMLVTNIYNLVDTAFVGTLGNSASGAVGIVFGFMAILQAIGFLFGQGSGSIISRFLGQKNIEEAVKTSSTAVFFSFFLAVTASLLCFFFLTPIVFFLGSTETIAPYARTYISWILLTAPCMVTSFTLNNILRYEGKAFYGMIGMLSGAVLNIFGDALLIKVFNMGISGAGLSTAVSQAVSFSILLIPFLRGKTQCRLSFSKIQWNPKVVGNIISTGSPSLVRQGLNSITTIILNFYAGTYGALLGSGGSDQAIAGMSIVARIFFFIFSVAIGTGQGFQPVSGFNYGARKFGRLRKAYRFTVELSEALMIVIGAVVFIFAPSITALFRDDPTVIEIATRALRFQCIGVLFLPVSMVTEMLCQSTGQKLAALVLSAMRSGIVFIPTLIIMALTRGLNGVEEAQSLAFAITFIPTMGFIWWFFHKIPDSDME